MGTETMAFFGDLTTLLKQNWLQFFQDNRSWITLQMDVEAVYTPDGGRRPSSYFILGVVNALEPQLGELMLPFSQLNSDADALIEVLELNFDPDLFLGNLANAQADILVAALTEEDIPDDPIIILTEIESDDPELDEVVLVESAIEAGDLSSMSIAEIAAAMGIAELEEQPSDADLLEILSTDTQEQSLDPNVVQSDTEDVWADNSSEPNQEQDISHFPNS